MVLRTFSSVFLSTNAFFELGVESEEFNFFLRVPIVHNAASEMIVREAQVFSCECVREKREREEKK